MAEYQDALDRARRLSVAREAALAGNESAMNVVTLDDLLIYTRSLICQLHSVKKIHAFLKVGKTKHILCVYGVPCYLLHFTKLKARKLQ